MNTMRSVQPKGKQAGFSMLEVLVSLLLIAIAMLGQAGLTVSAMKSSKGASLRMQAVLLSDEIAERIEANKTAAIAGSYEVVPQSSTPDPIDTDCATNYCDSAHLATYDLAVWESRVAQTLPGATWQITNTVAGNPATYTIVLTWLDRRDNTGVVNYAAAGMTETVSLTATKVVRQ